MVLSVATPFIQPVKATANQFIFQGPLNEDNTGVLLTGNVIVTPYVTSGAGDLPFSFTGTYIYNATAPILYFTYDWNNTATGITYHREYWIDSADNTAGGTYNIFFSESPMPTYIISFMDQVGLLRTYPNIELQKNINGVYYTIDKRPVDSQNIVTMDLKNGDRYRVVFGNGATKTVYGDLTTTATTGIQLVIRGVDFPKETLLLYQYVHASAIRDFLNPTGAITVSYEDLTNKTTSVTVTITSNGTLVLTQAFTNQTFSYTWTGVPNATSYEVTVAIVHQTFGSFNYKYYLLGEYQKASEPFSLSFLGSSMGISTAVLIPALLIIFVAGCFSEITAETAAVLTVIVAIILSALGWIEISQAAIITALALSVLAGIVTAKRRMSAY
jgi:hypothetical protein